MSDDDLNKGGLYPPIEAIQTHSLKIAARIAELAYMNGDYLYYHMQILYTQRGRFISVLFVFRKSIHFPRARRQRGFHQSADVRLQLYFCHTTSLLMAGILISHDYRTEKKLQCSR